MAKWAVPLESWNELVEENFYLKSLLSDHRKGQAVKFFCKTCTKPIWFVDDEPLKCPYCNEEGFHVPDIDAEIICEVKRTSYEN